MATSHKYNCTSKVWTYGAELELVDWPRLEPLFRGMAVDEAERHNVNSNGVAVDGRGKVYHLGGEILTYPSEDPQGPADQLSQLIYRWPKITSNYRSGLNVHIRVPGLRDDLVKLKQIQSFVCRVMPELLEVIDPIIKPTFKQYPDKLIYKGALNNYNKRLKDHHTLIPDWRLELQMKARTPKEFFEAEAIHLETKKVHWAIVPRNCVNMRQLLQTDTIEFRHFFMPKTPAELLNTTLWCKNIIEAALGGGSVSTKELLNQGFEGKAWPKCLPYDPWLDKGFYYTSSYFNTEETARAHIEEWLEKEVCV